MLKRLDIRLAVHLHASEITLHSAHHVIETQHSINANGGQSPVGEEQVPSYHKMEVTLVMKSCSKTKFL